MTREDIIKLLAVLTDNYNVKIQNPAGKATAWEIVLGEYNSDSIFKAARLHMGTSKFFPSPADLIKLVPRAEIVYFTPPANAIEAHSDSVVITPIDHAFLEAFCQRIGLGCEPDDSIYVDLEDWLNGGTGLQK